MVQIEKLDNGHEFCVWWNHERVGPAMLRSGAYVECRECGAKLGERTSVDLVRKAMALHASAGHMFSCRTLEVSA